MGATGGAVLKSAYSRITSQSARGTTRVFMNAISESIYQSATTIGDLYTLKAWMGDHVVTIDDPGSAFDADVQQGTVVLVGTQMNVVAETVPTAGNVGTNEIQIALEQLFAGSGEGEVSGDDTVVRVGSPAADVVPYSLNIKGITSGGTAPLDPTHIFPLFTHNNPLTCWNAPDVATATGPPACASASRGTPTTTATPRAPCSRANKPTRICGRAHAMCMHV